MSAKLKLYSLDAFCQQKKEKTSSFSKLDRECKLSKIKDDKPEGGFLWTVLIRPMVQDSEGESLYSLI